MQALYDQIDLLDLMNTCVTAGGPQWVGAPAGWAPRDPIQIIPKADLPATCGQSGCHTAGFLRPQVTQTVNQTAWCNFAGQGFQDGGSMSNYKKSDCRTVMTKLGCDPSVCDAAPAAVPAISSWGLARLAALLGIAAGWPLARRSF